MNVQITAESPSPTSSSSSSAAIAARPLVCSVCGDTKTVHKNYSVLTCDGCKSFFRRSILRQNKYVCAKGEQCVVVKDGRNVCQFCRLKKCRNVGMDETHFRDGRNNQISSTFASGAHKNRPKPMSTESRQLVDLLVQITHQCLNSFDPDFEKLSDLDCQLLERQFNRSCTLAEGLHEPVKVCPRWKLDFSCERLAKPHDFVLGWHRVFVYLADWVKALPPFQALPSEDREYLFRTNFIKLTLLFYGYHIKIAFAKDFDNVPFGNGSYVSCSSRHNIFSEVSASAMSTFRKFVAEPFEEMDVNEVELLLYKTLCLFECREALSDEGKVLAEKFVDKLIDAFFEYQNERFPNVSFLDRNRRYSRILMTMCNITEAWKPAENLHFTLSALGLLNLDGVLKELLRLI